MNTMSRSFQIHNSSNLKSDDVLLRQPKCIGTFSLDGKRTYHPDKRNLKHINVDILKEKSVSMDLDAGMDKVIRREKNLSAKENLDLLLQWILRNKSKFYTEHSQHQGFNTLSTDFVCFRGLLTKLMCTPYERKEEWIVHAIKWHGTIYLLNINTPQHLEFLANQTEKDHRMCSWGYKFEQYMTCEDTDKPVDESEEYNCVLRSRLTNHSLVYSAEVDGVDKELYNDQHTDLGAFIELKTTNETFTQRQSDTLRRFKMRKWYCQSHLSGVPTLICGYKEGQYVTRLEKFDIKQLPSMCKGFWSPDVMLRFLHRLLDFIKSSVIEERPAIYEFKTSLAENSIYSIRSPYALDFLPDWYTSQLFKV